MPSEQLSEDPIEEARQPLVDAMAQAFAVYGWPEVMGRLYARLYLADRPITQDELCEMLNVSKATVSTTLRGLESLHLVHRVGAGSAENSSGRPRIYFEAERDFMKVVQELLRHNARRELELMNRGLDNSRARMEVLATHTNPNVAAQAQADLKAIATFNSYRRWANRILWLVQSGERMQSFLSALWSEKKPEPPGHDLVNGDGGPNANDHPWV
jgi:DNA-binding transcriptional regulator GbsR (MarR family)